MILLRHRPVGSFDLSLVGVIGNVEDLVVVFCFRALELGLCFLEKSLDLRGRGVVFGSGVEGLYGAFVVFGVHLAMRLSDEAVERVRIELEGVGAVGMCFLFIVHLNGRVSGCTTRISMC